MSSRGSPFVKMSGSGNDFIFFDVRGADPTPFADPSRIRALCARGVGVGADGVVLLESSARAPYAMRYFNADGSLASLCGNATLCAARLGAELGIIEPAQAMAGFRFGTGVGEIEARLVDGVPEIELATPAGLQVDLASQLGLAAGERRIGFVEIGVPHIVILVESADRAALDSRGPELRRHAAFPHGANVNFVSREGGGWRYRTYERGVENETLACGTGAAACALLLREWGEESSTAHFRTSSGSDLTVSLGTGVDLPPRLRGSARIVYRGELAEI
ncbi:MAG TPA: diaminopimelate epimerase [Gemmatimonadaceae bacterium]|nr:diaminopimelate epimerase [Gemmatimonadaceae bacterium]